MELKRYIRINPGIVVDLFNKDISSYDIKVEKIMMKIF